MNTSILLAVTLLAAPSVLWAQSSATTEKSNTSTLKVESLKKADEKEKDIDSEITDARMRAQLGSKSKWSFKSSLSYSGGSIDDPFNSVRPNYRASATAESMSYLSGDVGINVRMGANNISFGTGMTINDPLHGDIVKPAEDKRKGREGKVLSRYDISTPYVSWSRGYRALNTQMISSAQYSHATDSDSVGMLKIFGSVSLSQTFLADFGTSGWNGGASISLGKTIYGGDLSDPYILDLKAAGKYKRSDLSFGLFPFMQYSFNDRYSFRTVFGIAQFVRYQEENDNVQLEPYQSVGVGISVTRDIYLYPNIQFTPKDIRADRTNVALSTNINLF